MSSATTDAGELQATFLTDPKRLSKARGLCVGVSVTVVLLFAVIAFLGPWKYRTEGKTTKATISQVCGIIGVLGGIALAVFGWQRIDRNRKIEVRVYSNGLQYSEGRKKEFVPWNNIAVLREEGSRGGPLGFVYRQLMSGGTKGTMVLENAKGRKLVLPSLLKDVHKLKMTLEKQVPEAFSAAGRPKAKAKYKPETQTTAASARKTTTRKK